MFPSQYHLNQGHYADSRIEEHRRRMTAALDPTEGSAWADGSPPTPIRRLLAAVLRRAADRLAPVDAAQTSPRASHGTGRLAAR